MPAAHEETAIPHGQRVASILAHAVIPWVLPQDLAGLGLQAVQVALSENRQPLGPLLLKEQRRGASARLRPRGPDDLPRCLVQGNPGRARREHHDVVQNQRRAAEEPRGPGIQSRIPHQVLPPHHLSARGVQAERLSGLVQGVQPIVRQGRRAPRSHAGQRVLSLAIHIHDPAERRGQVGTLPDGAARTHIQATNEVMATAVETTRAAPAQVASSYQPMM